MDCCDVVLKKPHLVKTTRQPTITEEKKWQKFHKENQRDTTIAIVFLQ